MREAIDENSQSVTNCHIFQLVAICHQLVFLAKVKTYFFYYLSSALPLRYLCARGGNSNSIPKVYQGYTKGKKNVIKVKIHIKNAAVALIFAKKFVYLEKKV